MASVPQTQIVYRPRPRVSIEQHADAIIAAHKRGETDPQIALRYGCHSTAVRLLLKRKGVLTTKRAKGRPRKSPTTEARTSVRQSLIDMREAALDRVASLHAEIETVRAEVKAIDVALNALAHEARAVLERVEATNG